MIYFNKKVKCNATMVALRLIDDGKSVKMDGFVLSEDAEQNNKLGFYQIVEIGSKAAKEYGLKVGDYVLADRLSTFYKSEPICLMEYNNIIVKTNADRSEYLPMKNMVFVKKDEDPSRDDPFYIPNSLVTGVITKLNVEESEEFPFTVGDRILMPKKCDVVSLGSEQMYIYRPDTIICKIED